MMIGRALELCDERREIALCNYCDASRLVACIIPVGHEGRCVFNRLIVQTRHAPSCEE